VVVATLAESATLMPAPMGVESKGIWRARLIEADVQGSSGYYPAEVLFRDGPVAFPAGTHVDLDHPTSEEDVERPERSVRDLAGYLVDGARFEESADGRGLFARIQFIDELKDRIKSLAPVIGLSIRAAGEIEVRPDGQRVIRAISEGLSVDVVTRAGAGGRLVTMTESKPGSPPAEGVPVVTAIEESTPSTSGSGALRSEIVSMSESISDRIEQLSVDQGRLSQVLRESMKLLKQIVEENSTLRESIESINERQLKADQQISESKKSNEVLADLIKSGLPVTSMVRIAENHRPGRDHHADITAEREYLKKIMRESERTELSRTESSGLGLIESAMSPTAFDAGASTDQLGDLESVLRGEF
jgi:regulator of replication initiation timing